MQNVANLYESHRLYVYQSCMYVFHRLFVEVDDSTQQDGESIEDIFIKVQKIFESYHLDSIYYHLNLVFEFLKLEYYNHYKVYRQAEKYFEEVNDACANLLVNYSTYTFPAQFLISKIERHLRNVAGFGLKAVVAVNRFPGDTAEEVALDADPLEVQVAWRSVPSPITRFSPPNSGPN